ncbi:Uncharacterized protein Fot_56612 [Forsythia ovata]|uniref:Uncharacterized protein n=1 Tax=Forsythia ovata TaxID=205694 RepID=A0ABD1NZ62_9LAMI
MEEEEEAVIAKAVFHIANRKALVETLASPIFIPNRSSNRRRPPFLSIKAAISAGHRLSCTNLLEIGRKPIGNLVQSRTPLLYILSFSPLTTSSEFVGDWKKNHWTSHPKSEALRLIFLAGRTPSLLGY